MPDLSHYFRAIIDDNVRLAGRTLAGVACLLALAGVDFAFSEPVKRELNAVSAGQIVFDIPAQSLVSALEAYSFTAAREVVYNGKLAIGRQSSAVKGTFTPEAALEELLDGTGLSPRYMAADAFMLVPSVPDPKLTNSPSPAAVASYFGRIQASLKSAFCANNRTRPGDYRLAVSFWIGATGAVSRVELLGSTGDSNLDAAIDRTIRGLNVGVSPPNGFAQPVTLMVTPQSPGMSRDCHEASRPVRASAP